MYTLEDLIKQSIFGREFVMELVKDGDIKPFIVSDANSAAELYSEGALYLIYREELKKLA